jgi:hypothetical protein
MANILCMAAALANSVFVAAADRVGVERGQPFGTFRRARRGR